MAYDESIIGARKLDRDDLSRRHEENDSPFAHGDPEIPSAVVAALSGGPLTEAAEQNAIDESSGRNTSVPDTTPYACDPQWGSPLQTTIQPPVDSIPIGIPEDTGSPEHAAVDDISEIIVPDQGDIMSEDEDWRDKLVDGLYTETARQIAKQRREARAKGTRPRVSFTATLSSALVEDNIVQSLVERLQEHGWTVTHDFNSAVPEFTVLLS